jgi:hypothetical protein
MKNERADDQAARETRVAWDAFQYWTGSRDVDRFRAAYLGHYPDRAAFGELAAVRARRRPSAAAAARLAAGLRPARRDGGSRRLRAGRALPRL